MVALIVHIFNFKVDSTQRFMAHQARQSGDAGTDEPRMPEMNRWLQMHRLNKTKFRQYFEDNDVITADLLKYNEQEIELSVHTFFR